MPARLVAVSQKGWAFPSTRLRLGPLERDGRWPLQVLSAGHLPSEDEIEGILAAGGSGATLILQRVAPNRDQMRSLREVYERVLLDFDDAIYTMPPAPGDAEPPRLANVGKHAGRLVVRGYPRASARRRPLIRALRMVDACVVGNSNLAAFARRHCHRVVEIPTTVEPIERVPEGRNASSLIWVGLGGNIRFLKILSPVLARLRETAEFTLTIVSSRPWEGAPIPTRFVTWSREAEHEALLGAAIGLSPLPDDVWTRGKSGFRPILYGGHALPVVASPVGITDRIVVDGETGLLATGPTEWVGALQTLLREPDRTAAMGERAWHRVKAHYSDEVALRLWTNLLERV